MNYILEIGSNIAMQLQNDMLEIGSARISISTGVLHTGNRQKRYSIATGELHTYNRELKI